MRTRIQASSAGERQRSRREHGQSLLELALVVPVLCVILFAVAEFGLMITDQVTLNHAAADGARISARGDSPTNSAAGQAEAQNYASDIRQCSSPAATVSYTQGIPDYVTVTVSCTYKPLTPLGTLISLLGGSLNTPPTLSATTTMRVQ
jgi:Flp pilus assembly protein TadG